MRARRIALLTTGTLLAGAAPAAAEPQGTPDERRAYVASGQYLRDVEAAVAPAKARLIERTEQIARDRGLCAAADLPAGTGAPRDATPLGPPETADGWLAVRPTSTSVAGRALRRSGVAVRPTSGGRRSGTLLRLPARPFALASTAIRAEPTGAIRFGTRERTISVSALRFRLSGTRLTVTGRLAGRRLTVLRGTTTTGRRDIDLEAGRAQVRSSAVALTPGAARRIRDALKVDGVRSGTVGRLSFAGRNGPPTITRAQCAALPAKPALVLDIDETALSNYLGTTGDPGGGAAGQFGPAIEGTGTALPPTLDLYRTAIRRGVAVFFVTARPSGIRPQTERNLREQGYTTWQGLSLKPTGAEDSAEFKSGERRAAEAAGFRVIVNAGDAQTDLDGGVAEAAFKLPNRFY